MREAKNEEMNRELKRTPIQIEYWDKDFYLKINVSPDIDQPAKAMDQLVKAMTKEYDEAVQWNKVNPK